MIRWLRLLMLATALLATSSCDSLGNLRKQPTQSSEIAFCPANAFINLSEYEVEGPKNNADFPRFAIEEATKYPNLKQAYTLLYECWNHYHPTPKVN